MPMPRALTEAQVIEARRLRAEDPKLWTLRRLADRYGCSDMTMHWVLNPDAYAKQRERDRQRTAQRRSLKTRLTNAEVTAAAASKKAAGIDGLGHKAISKADLAARLKEIPPDTRDLTARFFGDPLPGRSALDRKRQAQGQA